MYSHPVYSMHLDISPSGLLILFLPALFSVSVGSYTLFLSALYSVSVCSYSPFLSAHILCFSRLLLCFCRLIYSVSLLFNPFPCMEMPLLSCISKSIIHPSLFHFPHILSTLLSPSVAARHFFLVSCHTYSTVPFHPASSPVLACHTSSLTVFSYPSLFTLAG